MSFSREIKLKNRNLQQIGNCGRDSKGASKASGLKKRLGKAVVF